jgi:hypothetical protein
LRLPDSAESLPGYTAACAFTAEFGPVNPTSGAWHVAQD